MTINDKIRDEKLQYDINKGSTQIAALSYGKTDKYEYLTSEKILPSDKGRMIEQARFSYFFFRKCLRKTNKND